MYAVGHISLGYLTAKLLNRATKQNLNIPAIWTLSIIHDIDLLIPGLQHRGPTHSIILITIVFAPLLFAKKEKVAPYFIATAIHPFADYMTKGGAQLFWPLSHQWIQYKNAMSMTSIIETNIELTLFLTLIGTMIILLDYKHLLNSDIRNTLLLVPLCTILLHISTENLIAIPKMLIIPHIILLGIASISILKSLIHTMTKLTRNRTKTL